MWLNHPFFFPILNFDFEKENCVAVVAFAEDLKKSSNFITAIVSLMFISRKDEYKTTILSKIIRIE
jgi:hypothetical protein